MGRDSPTHEWELLYISLKLEPAQIFAQQIEDEQRKLGMKRFDCRVIDEEDFDNGRFRCTYRTSADRTGGEGGGGEELDSGAVAGTELSGLVQQTGSVQTDIPHV
jgi:hypothetical protein